MATVEVLFKQNLNIAMLVSFEAGDTVTADDGTGTAFDSASVDLRPYLDQFCPGWRSHAMVFMCGLKPGSGKTVPDGTQAAVNYPYAALTDDGNSNPKALSSVVLSEAGVDGIDAQLCLAKGDQGATLSADEAHEIIVVGYSKERSSGGPMPIKGTVPLAAETYDIDLDA